MTPEIEAATASHGEKPNEDLLVAGASHQPHPQPRDVCVAGEREANTNGSLPEPPPPKIEVIARAIDVEGKNPRRVIEGRNHLGQLVRLLLPEEHAGSKQRVTNAIIRAGFDCGTPDETSAIVERVMAASPSLIAMYVDHDGWHHNYSAFVLADKVYTATRIFSRYSEGVVEAMSATGKLDEHLDALKAFNQPIDIVTVGAVFAGLVAPLIGYRPLVVALSDATPDQASRVLSVSHSIFDAQCRDLTHVHQLNGASEAARILASARPEVPRKTRARSAHAMSPKGGPASSLILAVADKLAAGELSTGLTPSDLLLIAANTRPHSTTHDCVATPHTLHEYHGSVGVAFITELVKRRDSVVRNASTLIPQYRDGYAKQLGVAGDDDDLAMQTLTRVALLRFALGCATQFGVCPWTKEATNSAMGEIAARCHDQHVKRQQAFEREVINAVKTLARECAKVVKGRQLLLIEPAQFDEYVVAHRDKPHVLTVLRRRQLLVTTKGNPTQYQVRMPSKSDTDARRWMYAVDAAAIRHL